MHIAISNKNPQRNQTMNNLKTLLVGHMSPRQTERINAALLQKRLRDHQLPTDDRTFGSYLLVDVPTKEERHNTVEQVRPQHGGRDQAGDI